MEKENARAKKHQENKPASQLIQQNNHGMHTGAANLGPKVGNPLA